MVFWIIWGAILSGLLVIQSFAPAGTPSEAAEAEGGATLFLAIGLVVGALSLAIRFIAIPRLDTQQKKLPFMIVGLALAEGVGILGAFAVSPEFVSTRRLMLSIAVVCLVLSAPVYARLPGRGNPLHG